ncbi:nSTAND1 domain-containing NTPase [Streptomyces syringium]|uniref:nSTAND1 domain-containing NTPase n=1 Tax=Streptomyces syringium TaxID=76729 RepID=UPI00343C62B8
MRESSGSAIERAIAVVDAGGSSSGLAFLVGPREVITCAHVVEAAVHPHPASWIGHRLTLVFPLVAPGEPVLAEVVTWHPVADDESGDVAGLRVLGPLPPSVRAVRLSPVTKLWDHPYLTFGLPEGRSMGVWSRGRLLARQAGGWLQLEDTRTTGFPVARGFSGAPVHDLRLEAVVGMVVAVETRAERRTGYALPTSALLDAWPELRSAVDPPSPYRGLEAFRPEDAAVFHGRERDVDRLHALTRSHRVVPVVGGSGSGKTSLLHAGLVPRLARSDTPWAVLRPRAGTTLRAALARSLAGLTAPSSPDGPPPGHDLVRSLEEDIARGRLPDIVVGATESHHRELVLIIDQFEELVIASTEEDDRVLEQLLSLAVGGPSARPAVLRLVVALRADFFDAALRHPLLSRMVTEHPLLLHRLSVDDLRRVIERPIERWWGIGFEAGLVSRILDEVGSAAEPLPLVQFTLSLLWEQRSAGLMAHRVYEGFGGVTGALAHYAERVWRDGLEPAGQEDARWLFTQLVRPDASGRHTGRAVALDDLTPRRQSVVDRLSTARLLVSDKDPEGRWTASLVHDALIGAWPRLAGWVAEDRTFRVWQEELRGHIALWERGGRERGGLLTRRSLQAALRWLDERKADLTEAERSYILAGRSARRRHALLRTGGVALAVCLVLALVAAVVVVDVRSRQAADTRRTSASKQLAARAKDGATAPDTAGLAAVAAYRTEATPEAWESLLLQFFRTRHHRALLPSPDGEEMAYTTGSRGRLVAARSSEGRVLAWRPGSGERARVLVEGRARAVAVSKDESHLATAVPGDEVALWDARTHRRVRSLPVPPVQEGAGRSVVSLAFDASGRRLVGMAAGGLGAVVWDLRRADGAPALIRADAAGRERFSRVWPGTEGRVLTEGRAAATRAAGAGTNEVTIWSGRPPRPVRSTALAPADEGNGRVVSSSGEQALACEFTDNVGTWQLTDLVSGRHRTPGYASELAPCNLEETHLIELGDGSHAAVLGTEASVSVRPAPETLADGRDDTYEKVAEYGLMSARDRLPLPLGGPRNGMVVTTTANSLVALGGDDRLVPVSMDGAASSLVSRDDGRYAALVDKESRLRLYDLGTGRQVADESAPREAALAFVGRFLAQSRSDGVVLRSLPSLREVRLIAPSRSADERDRPEAIGADSAGRLLVWRDGMLTRWDVDSGRSIGRPLPVTAPGPAPRAGAGGARPEAELVPRPGTGQVALVVHGIADVGVRDIDRKQRTRTFSTASGTTAEGAAFSPDGDRIALIDSHGRTTVHRFADGGTAGLLSGTDNSDRLIGFSGGYLAAFDRRARLSALGPDGHLVQADLVGPELRQTSTNLRMAVTRSGETLLIASGRQVRSVPFSPGRWIRHLCALVGREPTAAERRSFPKGSDENTLCPAPEPEVKR